jgi:PAS domain S-box-containing protein
MNIVSGNNQPLSIDELSLRVADHVNAMLAYWDKNQIIRFANNAYSDWFGKTREELVDKMTMKELLGPLYEKNLPYINAVLNGIPQTFEREIKVPSGEIRHSIANYYPDIINGEVKGFFVHVADISGVKKLETELKASETKFKNVLEGAPDVIVILNKQGFIQIINTHCEKLFGYRKEELLGKSIETIIPNGFWNNNTDEKAHVYSHYNAKAGLELIGVTKNKREFPIEINTSAIELPDGICISAVIRDRTDHKKSQEKLREVSDRLKLATHTSSIGIWSYDIAHKLLVWDDIMFQLYGVKKETFSGAYEIWRSGLHPDDMERGEKEVQQAIHGEKEFDTEFRVIWPDQSVHYIKAKALVQRDKNGNAIQMIGTNWDITNQKIAELKIKEANERNRIFIEQAPNAIAMFDTELRYMAASQQWLKDYNLIGKEIIGRSHYEMFPEIGDDWKTIHQECLKGAINKCEEAPFERADGSVQWIAWDVRPWYISEGDIGGILMHTANITALKQKDQENHSIKEILDKTNEIARIGTWEMNLITSKITWSSVIREIHEVPDDYEPDFTSSINFIKEGESRNKIQKAVVEAIQHNTPYDLELELVTAKGNNVWARAIGQAEFEKGKCKRLYGVFQDISGIKEKNLQLQLSEERWRFALEGPGGGIWDWNIETNMVFFSDQWKRLLGYEPHEIGSSLEEWRKRVHPDDIENYYISLTKHFTKETAVYSNEHRIRCKDGTYKWILSRGKVMNWSKEDKPIRLIGTLNDISQLKRTEQKIAESEKNYRLLSENSSDLIAVHTLEGKFTYVSPSVKEFLGYTPDELIGRGDMELVHPDDKPKIYALKKRQQASKNNTTELSEFRLLRKNGSAVWVEVISRNLFDETQKIIGVQTSARNIDQRKAFEIALIVEKEKAEQANIAKSQFLSTMSHEIRTPMNAVIGLTNFLLDQNPRPDQLESLKLLNFSGENLLVIINDILDFSKIEAGKIEFEEIPFDFQDLLNNTIQMLRHRAVDKGIELYIKHNNALPSTVKGDPVRIAQIINNLIGNAIKFTENGYVELTVNTEDIKENHYTLSFSIKDTGIGISPDKQESIFDRFSQAGSHITRKFGGTGLGLAITKRLINLMGSDISVKSILGEGSVFSFTLILEAADKEEANTISKFEIPTRNIEGIKILLVDDNHVNQVVASNYLKKWGFDITLAYDGTEAVELIQKEQFHLVLMDIQMPEMNGYEATRKIRALEDTYFKELPILALTASAMMDSEKMIFDAGMNDIITKPFKAEELRNLILKHLPIVKTP